VYAAYSAAVAHKGQPTVVLAMTVKGYGMGKSGEAVNETHSVKKLDIESLQKFRDRFGVPLSDSELKNVPYYRPAPESPEMAYMRKRRADLGGFLPARRADFEALDVPTLDDLKGQLKGSGDREISTTMSFVRTLSTLVKDKKIGARVVPIIPDEARTFGMEGMFRQLGIYSSQGQRYTPQDAGQIMFYKEDKKGQILEEGINEAGAMSAWIATATSYSNHGYAMVPFYIYYSMFGFQRIMDLAWAAGDSQARGFMLGATAGRTTLNGEGLQHQDGHSQLMANMIPNCRSYDPTYAYELTVIIQSGLKRMFQDKENCFYYITLMNENYPHTDMPIGVEDGIVRGMYLLEEAKNTRRKGDRVQLLGCGTILREVQAAAQILRDDFGIGADIWSTTSINELRREGMACERWNLLHPESEPRLPYVTQLLQDRTGPVICATDYMKSFGEQLRPYIPHRYVVLGTDGFGRSDTRAKLRHHFEVNRYFVVVAALKALAEEGRFPMKDVTKAIKKFGIDPDKRDPMMC
jgi:pyruvate dehydrogenase E1 component